jgi:hypothetical protein
MDPDLRHSKHSKQVKQVCIFYLTSEWSALRHFFRSRAQSRQTRTFFCLRKYTVTVREPLRVVRKLEIVLVLAEIKKYFLLHKMYKTRIVFCLRKGTMGHKSVQLYFGRRRRPYGG